jgi:hypothetical protein
MPGHSPLLPKISSASALAPLGASGPDPSSGTPLSLAENAWAQEPMSTPAEATSRAIRSRPTRTFCCMSLSSGSRRNALLLPAMSVKIAPETTRVTATAMSISSSEKPACPARAREVLDRESMSMPLPRLRTAPAGS